MKKGSIVKIGFRKYELWISETEAIHFKGWFNIVQAKRLFNKLTGNI